MEPRSTSESKTSSHDALFTTPSKNVTVPSPSPAQNEQVEKAPASKQNAPKPPYTAFTPSRQIFIVLIATAAGFFAPLTGAVYLPSLVLFQRIFHTSPTGINATVSVYWAVFGVAPIFGALLSDRGGRKTIYIVSLTIFLVANALLAALPPSLGALFVLRIFQALGSSMVTSIGAGTVADVTEPAKRASRMGIFLLGPQLGPVLGPLIGGQFSSETSWRWIFGFLVLACLPVYLLVLFFLPETLRCLVGDSSHWANSGWFVKPQLRQKQIVEDGKYPKPPKPTPKNLLKIFLFVPNAIISITTALNFTGLSIIYVVFPRVWQTRYGWSGRETGYAYLAPGVALIITSFGIGRIGDLAYRKYVAQHGGTKPPPERRLTLQVGAFAVSAVGKAMFGWFVYKHFHPAAVLFGASLASAGTGIIMVMSTSYQTECMPPSAASLVALSGLMRNVGSAIGAAIINSLLQKMGYGWCLTGLAFIDIACIAPLVFVRVRGHVYREALPKPPPPPGK